MLPQIIIMKKIMTLKKLTLKEALQKREDKKRKKINSRQFKLAKKAMKQIKKEILKTGIRCIKIDDGDFVGTTTIIFCGGKKIMVRGEFHIFDSQLHKILESEGFTSNDLGVTWHI